MTLQERRRVEAQVMLYKARQLVIDANVALCSASIWEFDKDAQDIRKLLEKHASEITKETKYE